MPCGSNQVNMVPNSFPDGAETNAEMPQKRTQRCLYGALDEPRGRDASSRPETKVFRTKNVRSRLCKIPLCNRYYCLSSTRCACYSCRIAKLVTRDCISTYFIFFWDVAKKLNEKKSNSKFLYFALLFRKCILTDVSRNSDEYHALSMGNY